MPYFFNWKELGKLPRENADMSSEKDNTRLKLREYRSNGLLVYILKD